MGEISAALGLVNITHISDFIAINQRNYQLYARHLYSIPGIRLNDTHANGDTNCQYIVLEVNPLKSGLSRDVIMKILHAENIIAKRYFHPGCHRMTVYQPTNQALSLPVTNHLCDNVLTLPTGSIIDAKAIVKICNIIQAAVYYADKIRQTLGH